MQGVINYLDRTTVDPTTYYITPPPGVPVDNVRIDSREVEIADLRAGAVALDPDRDGLAPVTLDTHFAAFDDDAAVRRDLVPQMEQIARALLGREDVFHFDHAVRRRPAQAAEQGALRGSGTVRQPLHRVHCDYTPAAARAYVEQRLGDVARARAGRRLRIVNFWRPIVGPLRDDPLAICLPQSVAPADLVPIRHIYDGSQSEILGVAWNPAHRWFAMRDMMPHEALFFTLYDSGRPDAPVAPHTAFTLDDPPQPVPPRASFEFRLVVYDDGPAAMGKSDA